MKSVVLIGTNHRYQVPKNAGAEDFRAFIEESCREYRINAIGEEMSLDALKEDGAVESICKVVADFLCISHQYSDPDRTQRHDLSIKQTNEIRMIGDLRNWDDGKIDKEIRQARLIRENYWVEQMNALNRWPMLFVCGADHFLSIDKLLKKNNISVTPLISDWAPTDFLSAHSA